jgi:hypothetical protein
MGENSELLHFCKKPKKHIILRTMKKLTRSGTAPMGPEEAECTH